MQDSLTHLNQIDKKYLYLAYQHFKCKFCERMNRTLKKFP